MSQIYANTLGKIIYLAIDNDEVPEAIPDAVSMMEIDLDTNMGLIKEINEYPERFVLLSSVLRRNEIIVTPSLGTEKFQAKLAVQSGYAALPEWAKNGTADAAETYITNQVLNGYTVAQVNSYVDTTIVNVTAANVNQINAQLANIRTVLKTVGGAIITIRGMLIIIAKLLIYIRDLVLRFKTSISIQSTKR